MDNTIAYCTECTIVEIPHAGSMCVSCADEFSNFLLWQAYLDRELQEDSLLIEIDAQEDSYQAPFQYYSAF